MSKKSSLSKFFLYAGLIILVGISLAGYYFYQMIYQSNTNPLIGKAFELYIPSNGQFENVMDTLKKYDVLSDYESFKWVAEKKNYISKVKPGRYEIKVGANNNSIINMLRSGKQKPVKLTFNSIRTKYELAGKISNQLEFDSVSLIKILNDKEFLSGYGFTPESVISMFIPNTYLLYWNISPEKFFEKMNKEYNNFWNEERISKLKKLNMTKLQVSTLASIVQAEQSVHRDEQPIIAGVYMNRIKSGMLLESCPTLVFALGDFSRQRILNKDKEIESPYNTYKNPGLPPGPINLPEISAIDAVLNYVKHDYIFLCAKDDFSGYHYFSTNFSDHNKHAILYQNKLNKKGIKH
jgi:UPF0755 protein